MQVTGILQEIGEIKQLAVGTSKTGKPWTLWGSDLIVNGVTYGLTNFSESKLKEELGKLAAGDELTFESEQKGEYQNVKDKGVIGINSHHNPLPESTPTPKERPLEPTAPVIEDIAKQAVEIAKTLEATNTKRVDIFNTLLTEANRIYLSKLINWYKKG